MIKVIEVVRGGLMVKKQAWSYGLDFTGSMI